MAALVSKKLFGWVHIGCHHSSCLGNNRARPPYSLAVEPCLPTSAKFTATASVKMRSQLKQSFGAQLYNARSFQTADRCYGIRI